MRRSIMTGLDGANFQLKLVDADANTYMETQQIKNKAGQLLSEVWIKRGILNVYINFPKLLRENNVWPLSLPDYPKLKEAESSLIQAVQDVLEEQWIFCDVSKSILKKIECGSTQKVAQSCSCDAVNRLINCSFHEDTNMVYQAALETYRYRKRDDYVVCPFEVDKVKYKLKSYDKSREQHDAGNVLLENGLLRIEIIFLVPAIKSFSAGMLR